MKLKLYAERTGTTVWLLGLNYWEVGRFSYDYIKKKAKIAIKNYERKIIEIEIKEFENRS